MPDPVILVHGGAGPAPSGKRPEDDRARHDALRDALAEAGRVLENGGEALDAVVAAAAVLEDCPLFNAGRGAVLNSEGRAELDAAVMRGDSLAAGAVAAVARVRNPVRLARVVMERSGHVLMAGEGAERLAFEHGIETVDPDHHVTERQLRRLERRRDASRGTVGAVALDSSGRLAAATSTGGRDGQLPGRVGDSPLIGCGTYAGDGCAVSVTGDGEPVVRAVAAHEVAVARRGGMTLGDACRAALDRIAVLGGEAGLIAVDADGETALPFDSPAMHRGIWRAGGEPSVATLPGGRQAPR